MLLVYNLTQALRKIVFKLHALNIRENGLLWSVRYMAQVPPTKAPSLSALLGDVIHRPGHSSVSLKHYDDTERLELASWRSRRCLQAGAREM
ncbi:hypothetical protein CPB83DRAFT_864399 [Crepidotus variabilis]|uniref:Uncharacterized protein n=1 Tax=Crepidotus variabilis TaxID=179855 RepID=A0A9P6JJ18_9AGAR|nr:hypothetical protein CPB83DRAFT_864399 [Crepidotus variabilis]